MIRSKWVRPETIFLVFSLAANLALLAMITPFAGGNERMNYQRAVLLAGGHVAVAPASMPGGVRAILDLTSRFLDDRPPPFTLTAEQRAQLRAIPLAPDQPRVVEPNAIAVLHPVAYLPQAPVMALAMKLGQSPLRLFELGRLAGMIAGIALTFFAIRLAPRNRYLFAATAMLPQPLFSRSTLDADQLTNGVAFFFLALLLREIAADGPIRRRALAALVIAAFVLAQAKSAYLLLPLLALFIPAERFGSPRQRAAAIAMLVVPGLVGSIVWMLALQGGYFKNISYVTWSGLVEPGRQVADVLHHPLQFVGVLARTLCWTPLIPDSLLGFLSEFGPPVSVPLLILPAFLWLLTMLFLAEAPRPGGPLDRAPIRLAAVALSLVSALVILTLLYVQWTRHGAPTIDGFHGRYLTPLVPLLIILPRGRGRGLRLLHAPPALWLTIFCAVSAGTTLWVTSKIY